jgi:hypothetical protein
MIVMNICLLKGTVARDFTALVFFVKSIHFGPCSYPKLFSNLVSNSQSYSNLKFDSPLHDSAGSQKVQSAAARFDSPLHNAAERFDSTLQNAVGKFDSPLHHAAGRFLQQSLTLLPAASYSGEI